MKIEVLYLAECPFHPAAVDLVRKVLTTEGITVDVHEVLIIDGQMAKDLKFCGSPTIRVNGRDVAPESPQAQTFALSCRLFQGSKQAGLPPAEMIHHAVLNARREERT